MPWESAKRGLPTDVGQFELCQTIRFRSDIAQGVVEVEEGEVSDLASIPGPLEWFLSSDDQRIAGGAWVHDYLYRRAGAVEIFREDGQFSRVAQLTRREADCILAFEAMPDLGASVLQQQAVFRALRLAGASSWRRPAPAKG